MDILTPDQLPTAARHLTSGRMVAVPTARWYMLCARAVDPAATAAIFRVKQRAEHKPLLLLLESPATASDLFHLSDDAHRLTARLWPGDLALRLPWQSKAAIVPAVGSPALVGCPGGLLGRLVSLVGEPLAAAVCSVSSPAAGDGDHPALTADQVAAFDHAARADIAAVLDDGICPLGQHMTIVDCPADKAAGLDREGTVHARAVEAALAQGGSHVG